MINQATFYKSIFLTSCDGCYGVDKDENFPTSYSMGVCKLDYDAECNILIVHLRRPGLLIGKGGRTIKAMQEAIGCTIKIVEVLLVNGETKTPNCM